MAFGDAEAADGRRAHAALTYATFSCRNPLPCDFPALRRPRHSNPFPPLTQVKLWTPPPPLSQHWLWPYEKPPKQSALIWLSEWLLNWEYLVLGFLDAGWKGASHFSARSRISLRGLTLTEADSLPVRLQGAEGLGSNKTLREKHQASNERGENPGRTFQFPSYQNHALYVKLSNLSAWAICPFK